MIRVEIPHEKIKCDEVAIFILSANEVADSNVMDDGTFVLFFESKGHKELFIKKLDQMLDKFERADDWLWKPEEITHLH